MEPTNQQSSQKQERSLWIAEMERRANDLLIVYNPLSEDYIVYWDKAHGAKRWRIPAQKDEVVPRYIARKYFFEMISKITMSKANQAVIKANEDRIKKGMAAMTKHEEQFSFEMPMLTLSEEDYKKLLAILYKGIYQEYGIDREAAEEEKVTTDRRPVFDRALEKIELSGDVKNGEPKPEDKKDEEPIIPPPVAPAGESENPPPQPIAVAPVDPKSKKNIQKKIKDQAAKISKNHGKN